MSIGTASAFSTGYLYAGTSNGSSKLDSSSGSTTSTNNSVNRRVNSGNLTSKSAINTIVRNLSASYSTDAIESLMESGEVDQAIALYESMLEDVEGNIDDYGYDLSDAQKTNIAKQVLDSSDILATATENTHDAFVTGLLEGIPLLNIFAQGTSTEEATAELNGTSASSLTEAKEAAGAAVAGAVSGAAIGATVLAIHGAMGATSLAAAAAGAAAAFTPFGWCIVGACAAVALVNGLVTCAAKS